MRNLPEFKIRCSSIGKIMTEPRTKGEGLLSKTCRTYLESWVNEIVYGRRIEFTSKQTSKGIEVEDDAIVYASGYIPEMGLSSKNTRRFTSQFLQGEPDVISTEYVFDVKSSWSHATFPLYAPGLPESDYEWQVLGYMALTGKTKGRVVYALMSMPEEMILREARYRLGQEYSFEEYEEFAAQFRYDDLPPHLRLKEYEIQYDAEKIAAIEKRVLECRAYIQSVILPELLKNQNKYQPVEMI